MVYNVPVQLLKSVITLLSSNFSHFLGALSLAYECALASHPETKQGKIQIPPWAPLLLLPNVFFLSYIAKTPEISNLEIVHCRRVRN